MKLICDFEVKIRPVSWRLILQDRKIILAKICRDFITRFQHKVGEQIPNFRSLLVPIDNEIELIINFYLRYDRNFKTPEKKFIPDLDHTVTLIQNALQGQLFDDDRQIASLLVHRWKVETKEEEKIQVRIYQIID